MTPIADLIAQIREDEERMTPGPWTASVQPSNTGAVTVFGGETGFPVALTSAVWNRAKENELADALAIAGMRNRNREVADALEAMQGEVELLRACLAKANDSHETFERLWYLACDERDAIRADVECMRPVYEAAMRFTSAEHTLDVNCNAGDCDDCPARTAEHALFVACGNVRP